MAEFVDYLIIGGGSAGCVLANRLSEDPDVRVCLLEAGPPDWNPLIRVPVGITGLMRSRRFNWAYRTEAQSRLDNRRMFWPRGRTLGGSSAINAMCYTRGHPADYDAWEADGATGWNWQSLLPYFRRSERFAGGADAWHGDSGPLSVESLRTFNPFCQAFVDAAVNAGIPHNPDFNGATQAGVGPYHVMQEDGRRCSNAWAYLHPVRKRPNLSVITGALVHQLLQEGDRINGALYSKGRHRYSVMAGTEVILAAGAIGTPHILQLSGIGSPLELEAAGVAVRHELPGVGGNLQDHLDVSVAWSTKDRRGVSFHPSYMPRGARGLWDYFRHRRGELCSNMAEAGAFLHSSAASEIPDLQMHFLPAIEDDHGLDLRRTIAGYGYTLRTCFLRPESRGRIGLHTGQPQMSPRIDPDYLSVDADAERLVDALERARDILSHSPIAAIGDLELKPGSDVRGRAALRLYVAAHAETIYHPVGTCRMGVDADSVVGPELRVHGLRGLRVVDASVFPRLVGGNTNAPVTAVAERAADLIRGREKVTEIKEFANAVNA